MKIFIIFLVFLFLNPAQAKSKKSRLPSSSKMDLKEYKAKVKRILESSHMYVFCDNIESINENFNSVFEGIRYKVIKMTNVPGFSYKDASGEGHVMPNLCIAVSGS